MHIMHLKVLHPRVYNIEGIELLPKPLEPTGHKIDPWLILIMLYFKQ
jgi:hypothetical protein